MLKGKQIKKQVVVFSQLSRKSYAVFASLKCVVTIAHLSMDICKAALLKSSTNIQFVNLIGFDEDEAVDLDSNEIIENPVFNAATLPVAYNSSDVYSRNRINDYQIKEPIFCDKQNMGFLILNITV